MVVVGVKSVPLSWQEPACSNEGYDRKKCQQVERVQGAIEHLRVLEVTDHPDDALEIVEEDCSVDVAPPSVVPASRSVLPTI